MGYSDNKKINLASFQDTGKNKLLFLCFSEELMHSRKKIIVATVYIVYLCLIVNWGLILSLLSFF